MNPFLFVCSHHGVGAVAQNHSAAPARILSGLNSRIAQAVSKNRHDGHAKLEIAPRDFRADFGLRQVRPAAPNTFGDRRIAPS